MRTHTHTHTYIHTYIHTHTHTNTHTHIYIPRPLEKDLADAGESVGMLVGDMSTVMSPDTLRIPALTDCFKLLKKTPLSTAA